MSGLPTVGSAVAEGVHPSPQGTVGMEGAEVVVPGMPGAGEGSTMVHYEDSADVAKPSHPPAHPHGLPFELKR